MGTLEMPDKDATLHCVATVLISHLTAASSRPPVPLLPCLCPHAGAPSVRELAAFIKRILKLAKRAAECIIMTLVCVERSLGNPARDVAPHGRLLPHLKVKRYF
ncbi:hypothetical protein PsorP6_009440 [Peronosclerospora sorghi]|uniref:Uncharacterized protein n=1 Tax=Peronosclerospora sorghi TaxID=230839 RepID=A0ACC0VZA9_9STRA|nr:hypothetical protein PsorP6_009440 [Peronosclerospora sorghi]